MSTEGRTAIVDALNDVDGIECHSARPGVLINGTAWPVWESTTWDNECATTVTWSVFVAVPAADDQSIVEALEPLIQPVTAALWDIDGESVTATPVQAQVADGNVVPCLRFQFQAPR